MTTRPVRCFPRSAFAVFVTSFVVAGAGSPSLSGTTIDFEDLGLAPESYYNGSDGAGQFQSGGAVFVNDFVDFGGGFSAWSGWSYSNRTDTLTPGFENQYSAYPGSGAGGSANFGVAFASTDDPTTTRIELPAGMAPRSVDIANTTYAALSMLAGDAFAKKFGGPGGDDPDFFVLEIVGLDAANTPLNSVSVYLADYRFTDSAEDHILSDWTTVDLTALGSASRLGFKLTSSDVGQFGMNTPAYFALDNLEVVPTPEPSTMLMAGVGLVISMLFPCCRCRAFGIAGHDECSTTAES